MGYLPYQLVQDFFHQQYRLVPQNHFPPLPGPVQYVQADSLPRLPGGKVRKAKNDTKKQKHGRKMAGQTEKPGGLEV